MGSVVRSSRSWAGLPVLLLGGALVLAGCGRGVPKGGVAALDGEWRRTDGAYVLRLAGMGGTNGMQVAYFNPRPVRVARSQFRREPDGVVSLVVELRDAGYPGSTYALRHDAAADTLTGTYYHAGLRQTFDVTFVRDPPR